MEFLGNITTTESPLTVITPALLNAGGAPSMMADVIASRPSPGIAGRLFVGTDNYTFYIDNGISWDTISPTAGLMQGATLQRSVGTIPIVFDTTHLAISNTLPTITAGTEIWSQTFTPLALNSHITVRFSTTVDSGTTNNAVFVLLFRNNVCINVAIAGVGYGGTNRGAEIMTNCIDNPSTLSTVTYSARMAAVSGTWYCNRLANGTMGNGMITQYSIEEQTP